jgi:hypothetical protein
MSAVASPVLDSRRPMTTVLDSPRPMTSAQLDQLSNRTVSMDAVQRANSGHPGMGRNQPARREDYAKP